MTTSEGEELEGAIRRLEELAKKRRRPDRFDARELLIALGERLRESDAGAPTAAADVERVEALGGRLGPAWPRAVREELELAGTEYVRSVDARYLALADYDFEYTLSARERLEARLLAARALGIEPAGKLESAVERADARLARALEGRG